MTIEDVLRYFGTAVKMDLAIGISRSNVYYWKKVGYIPITSQLKLETLTRGALQADIRRAGEYTQSN